MRFSIWASLHQPWEDVVDVARFADDEGWHTLYVADHFMGDGAAYPVEIPTLEATAAVAALAGMTNRIRLGPFVLGGTYRHPAVVANWAATVDRISCGRLVLGLGAGWQENEHERYGIALGAPGARVERFEEALAVIGGLLREDVTTFRGRYYEVRDAPCEPKPVQPRLPILVGAEGDRMLRVVAAAADEWNISGPYEQLRERRSAMLAALDEIGRDPRSLHTSTQAHLFLVDDRRAAERLVRRASPRAHLAGRPEDIAEGVARLADLGVDEFIVPDFTLGPGSARREALGSVLEAFHRALPAST